MTLTSIFELNIGPEAQNLVNVRMVRQGKETVQALVAAGTAYWLKASIDPVTKEIRFKHPLGIEVSAQSLVSWELGVSRSSHSVACNYLKTVTAEYI